jgi:nitroreductase
MSTKNDHAAWKEVSRNNPLIDAIERRISTNLFDSSQAISDDQINELVRLATRAPTAFNLQNWRFIAVRTPEAKARLRKVAYDQAKVTDAAVTFIICGQLPAHEVMADRLRPSVEAGFMPPHIMQSWERGAESLYFEQPQMQRDEAIRTATFGAATLIFAAEAHGLASGAMVGFDPVGVAREFELTSDEVPVVLLTVGYPAAGNWPQKPRRPVSQVLDLV